MSSTALSRLVALAVFLSNAQPVLAGDLGFERVVLDADFPGAYQVEVADVDGDGKLDVVALGGNTCAWYQNPNWTKRVITGPAQAPGVISCATKDLDGDGRAEVAIAYEFEMNTPTRGKLGLAVQGSKLDDPWKFVPVADVPSIHRVRWATIGEAGSPPALIVAPIFGPGSKPPTYDQDQAHLWIFRDLQQSKSALLNQNSQVAQARLDLQRPVWHAIRVLSEPGLGTGDSLLTADNRGVGWVPLSSVVPGQPIGAVDLVPGATGPIPTRGASEIHWGRMADGRRFLATLEPWHGSEVVVYPSDQPVAAGERFTLLPSGKALSGRADAQPNEPAGRSLKFPTRTVIDTTLDAGHALWVADVDGDGDDEVFAGHRGKDHRVSVYDYDRAANRWMRTVIDQEIAAQDLRGGDLDGDGRPDVVAVGGATKNVVWYRLKPGP